MIVLPSVAWVSGYSHNAIKYQLMLILKLEAVSKLSATSLSPEIGDNKAPCTGNSGDWPKSGNAASADFRTHPEGLGLFSRISALFVAHLATAKPRSSRLELRKNNSRRGRR